MPKILSPAQVAQYQRDGFACPAPVLNADEVRELRADLEHWEKQQGHPLDFPEKSKSYLLYKWADTLVHHPKVLDAVEDLIGPDILLYHSTMWIKEAHTPAHVRWHQDGAYFFLDPLEHVTAWVALSEASELAGCMRIVPGTHRLPMIEHDDKPSPHNMIKRGQGISDRFDGEKGVSMPLEAGEMSLHHTALVHCSPGNDNSDHAAWALASRSFPRMCARWAPVAGPSALLVRGQDRYGQFRAGDRGSSRRCRPRHRPCARRSGTPVPPAPGPGLHEGRGVTELSFPIQMGKCPRHTRAMDLDPPALSAPIPSFEWGRCKLLTPSSSWRNTPRPRRAWPARCCRSARSGAAPRRDI